MHKSQRQTTTVCLSILALVRGLIVKWILCMTYLFNPMIKDLVYNVEKPQLSD